MKKRYVVFSVVGVVVALGMAGGPSTAELQNISTQATTYRSGFGTVVMASFNIYNNNEFGIKDPVVYCSHLGASGSEVDYNRRTIYQTIPAHSSTYVNDINMGFAQTQQITRSVCKVTSFTKMQASQT